MVCDVGNQILIVNAFLIERKACHQCSTYGTSFDLLANNTKESANKLEEDKQMKRCPDLFRLYLHSSSSPWRPPTLFIYSFSVYFSSPFPLSLSFPYILTHTHTHTNLHASNFLRYLLINYLITLHISIAKMSNATATITTVANNNSNTNNIVVPKVF